MAHRKHPSITERPPERELLVLRLKESVLFPGGVLPLTTEHPDLVTALRLAERTGVSVVAVLERASATRAELMNDLNDDDDTGEIGPIAAETESEIELCSVGTEARVLKVLDGPDGKPHPVVRGLKRLRIVRITAREPLPIAVVEDVDDAEVDPVRVEALAMTVKKAAKELISLVPGLPRTAAQLVEGIEDPGELADLLAVNLEASLGEKQELLERPDLEERLERVLAILRRTQDLVALSRKIDSQVKDELTKTQREYYLRQQQKAIEEELGGPEDSEDSAIEELEKRLTAAQMPAEGEKAWRRELERLKTMQPASLEYALSRTYLEWLADLPWTTATPDSLDLLGARAVLDARHYGLDHVKKRIIEYLAVRKLKPDLKGPILCLVGPPGVGKTSLGQSIAEALGRKFHRVSLGGVRDEAEIRGHRRTYVGSLPGRIIQTLRKVGTKNPVLVLDEVDKLAADFRGDPSAALLEVLDPEQNSAFVDHYLDVPFDLSQVLFIATANQIEPVPPALRDRMEVIELPGYTRHEKRKIAEAHLLPRVLSNHGVTAEQLDIQGGALDALIDSYTREAGVRNLERSIAGVVRGVAVEIVEGDLSPRAVGAGDLPRYLGPEPFDTEMSERTNVPGVATALAWTPEGGDILFVEVAQMPGVGRFTLTGQLGEVMRESAQAALSWLRTRSDELGVAATFWEKHDLHLHLPSGGVPKDGPSAGVAIAAALASMATGVRVRGDVAMTGELTLRGLVLPVSGVKEKVLAAARAGVEEVILPERNQKDLWEVPEEVRRRLKVHFVSCVEQALDLALERPSTLSPPTPRRRAAPLS